jgi:magnesium transporter
MFESVRHNSMKRGEAPGTAIYSGTDKDFAPSLLCVDYSAEAMVEQVLPYPFELPVQAEGTDRLLLMSGLHEAEQVQALAERYGMHPLAVEDVLNTGHRPSMDEYDDHVVISLRHIEYDRDAVRLRERHVSIVCREGVVIGFLEERDGIWEGLLNRLRKGKGRIRKFGSMYLAIAMLDVLVDGYFGVISTIGADVEALEESLGEDGADEETLMRIYALKRIVVALRNALLPAQQALSALHRNEEVEISEDVEPFFGDVKGHADQVVEAVQALHDLLSGLLDLQISLAGMRMNNVMKFLTVIATIFIPLTFIAGLYGMNFRYMPELDWRYGYPAALGIMFAVGGVMLYYFKKNRWL